MSDTARDQAAAQYASVARMVAALNVDYGRLQELRDDRRRSSFPSRVLATNPDHTSGWWEDEFPEDAAELAEFEEAAGECESEEDAQRQIQEDALSVEVRSGWHSPCESSGPEEFRIVLCTGGPHVEILGELDGYSEPSRAWMVYRGWGESGEYHGPEVEQETLLAYCRQFYFGV